MSADDTIRTETAGLAPSVFSELGKLASPAVRAGVLLASIANNVMTNPRNAAIVAVLIVVAMPFYWYWKRRSGCTERFLAYRETQAPQDAQRGRPIGTSRVAIDGQRTRIPRRASPAA